MTESGAFIVPSRTSILETLPKIVSSPPKLSPKSTIGFVENIIFQIKYFYFENKVITIGLLVMILVGFLLFARAKLNQHELEAGKRYRSGGASSGILGEKTSSPSGGFWTGLLDKGSGYFHLDGKEGLLSGGVAKAD